MIYPTRSETNFRDSTDHPWDPTAGGTVLLHLRVYRWSHGGHVDFNHQKWGISPFDMGIQADL